MRVPTNVILRGACAGLLLLLACDACAAEWGYDAQAGVAYDDNLPNAFESEDRKGDTALLLSFAGGLYHQLNASTGVSASLLAESSSYLHYTGLTNLGAGVRVQLRHKFGVGAQAPWAMASARAVHYDYHYDYRDGWQTIAGIAFGSNLGERWTLSATGYYDDYNADHLQPPVLPGISTAAYDTSGWNLGAQASFLATQADLLTLTYTWRNGTFTSVTTPDPEVLEYSNAVAVDPVYGDGFRVAYRIDGQTDTVSLGWSHALGRRLSANLVYSYRRSRPQHDLEAYYSNAVSISLSYTY